MDILIVEDKISINKLQVLAEESFGDMVKAVVDIKEKIMAIGGQWHADAEAVLLQHGSGQADLWGINIYPTKPESERIEFSSLINVRPSANNRSMEIMDEKLRAQISQVVNDIIQ